MALIKITDTEKAKGDAQEILVETVKLESASTSINQILREIKSYWEQTQQDAQSFSEDLGNEIETLNNIIKCNNDFSDIIMNYALNQEKTGQRTVE